MRSGMRGGGQEPGAATETEGRSGQTDHSGRGRFLQRTASSSSCLRQRDIFPLPAVKTVSGDFAGDGVSRCAFRRRLRRAYIGEWAEDCVKALNEMSGAGAVL